MTSRTPLQRLTAAALATLLGLSVLAGCSSDSEPSAEASPATSATPSTTEAEPTTTTVPPLDPELAYVAQSTVAGEQSVYAEPSDDADVKATFPNPWLLQSPLVFLVDEQVDADWWKVYLPTRPNGSTGFVKASEVDVTPNPYRIEVYLSDFRLVTYNGDDVILDTTVAVAANATPTPGGLYYITELRGEFPRTDTYGSFAYGLSGFSEVHLPGGAFGPGQLGIHGTNQPELIGQQVSNGCIRMRNEDIELLVGQRPDEFTGLPLGVPVEVIE